MTNTFELQKKISYLVNEFNSKNYNSDIFSWAKEIIWFGRRVGKYRTSATVVNT